MHFCIEEVQMFLFVLNSGAEHVGRYVRAYGIYVCSCARCLARKVFP